MEVGYQGLTDRESGVWVSTMAPLDPEIIREKYSILDKFHVSISEFSICYFLQAKLFFDSDYQKYPVSK